MPTALDRSRVLLTTAWVGSSWTIAYLVAPTLFASLPDQIMAGTIAGRLFLLESWLSVFCGIVIMALVYYRHKQLSWLVAGMVVCTVLGYFVLHPFMAELRATGLTTADTKWKFGMLHTLSSGFYLIQSVLGAMLVLNGPVHLDAEQSRAADH